MYIKDIMEPQRFFQAVSQCAGRVELVSSEGDRLNLKSTLCQYIALTQMFKDERIQEMELVVSDPKDYEKLRRYLVLTE